MKQVQTNKVEWREIELGDLIELKYGSSLPENKRENGAFKVYGSNGVVGYHNAGITKGRTIIVGRKGSIGKINLSEESCFPIDTTYYIDETKMPCDLKWLYFILKKLNLESLNRAAAVPGLNRRDVYQKKVLLPNLDEQRRIVGNLERAESLKEMGKRAGELLNEYLKSLFNEMFYNKNLEEVKLANEKYFEIVMGQSPAGSSYNKFGKGMPFFQGKKEFGEKYPIVEQWTTEPSKIAQPNDILISIRAPVGSINLANIKCCIGRGLASIRCKHEIETDFVYSFIKINEKEIERLGNGSTFKAITSKQLLNLKIPLPPLHLQQQFAKIVERVEIMKEKVMKANTNSETFFNSLMHKAFKGEL